MARKTTGKEQKAKPRKPTGRPRKITARVTHLEMRDRPQRHVPQPSRPRLALLSSQAMPVHFYRYLYEQVGRSHHWYNRRVMDDETLAGIIHDADTKIEVLYADGNPAGFFELDATGLPDSVEIAYFGIMPDYQGRGLGKWFLNCAIERAFDLEPAVVTVHTNSLDHPSALRIYQQMGFEPVGISEETVTEWG